MVYKLYNITHKIMCLFLLMMSDEALYTSNDRSTPSTSLGLTCSIRMGQTLYDKVIYFLLYCQYNIHVFIFLLKYTFQIQMTNKFLIPQLILTIPTILLSIIVSTYCITINNKLKKVIKVNIMLNLGLA